MGEEGKRRAKTDREPYLELDLPTAFEEDTAAAQLNRLNARVPRHILSPCAEFQQLEPRHPRVLVESNNNKNFGWKPQLPMGV